MIAEVRGVRMGCAVGRGGNRMGERNKSRKECLEAWCRICSPIGDMMEGRKGDFLYLSIFISVS